MIERLDNSSAETAKKLQELFSRSYAIEARFLNVADFPPMKRSLDNFIKSETCFYGIHANTNIVAVIEISVLAKRTEIHSLVVHPGYFRKGLATSLLSFVIETFRSESVVIDTGAANIPAISLYKKIGFQEIRQWNTGNGITMKRFVIKTK